MTYGGEGPDVAGGCESIVLGSASTEFEPALVPALERLTEQQRMAVLLVEGMGWGHRDVGRLLGISVSTVRTHVRRALRALREDLHVNE